MADEIKFTDEELKNLGAIQQSYQNIQSGFGQLKVQRILLEQQLNGLEEAEVNLESEYEKAQENERTFVKSLNEQQIQLQQRQPQQKQLVHLNKLS